MSSTLIPIPGNDEDPEPIDFSSPEDVLFVVTVSDTFIGPPSWKEADIESTTVINGKDGVMGAASYEASYGSFLDYTVMDMTQCPGEGYWVVENVTADYHEGDGYSTDDDMRFHCGAVRRATPQEIMQI